jgi:predicted O-methyltransferase YrrM
VAGERAETRERSEAGLRAEIRRHFDEEAEIRLLRHAPRFGGHVFVVDTVWRADLLRILGSVTPGGLTQQQSAMSLTRPERLVFQYERLMSLALGLAAAPRRALLLGLGGGAMARFLAAHLPGCDVTAVEHDAAMIEIARRFFYIRGPVVERDALAFLAETDERFDVILVDLYDAAGAVHARGDLWERCLGALAPGGCVAANWADFDGNASCEASARDLAGRAAGALYVTPHGLKDNLVQFAWTDTGLGFAEALPRLHRFERERHLPFRIRNLLRGCLVGPDYPRHGAAEEE